MNNVKALNVRNLTKIAILSAISIVLGLTPLGFIPIGIAKVTTMHIPVIIGGIIEGPLVGGVVGMIFGLFSMYQAIINPTPTSFVFRNPVIALLPRIAIGVFSGYVFRIVSKSKRISPNIKVGISSLIGSLTNTFGVLSLIYLLYGERFVTALGLNTKNMFNIIFGIGITNGIPEAIVAIIITIGVTKGLKIGDGR